MMRLFTLLLTIAVCSTSQATPTVFVNVNVIPMTSETVLKARTVVVDAGVIQRIGDVDAVPVPEDALVVDGTDRYLLPGLAELHAHVPDVQAQNLDGVLTLFAANGVTTIRGMLGRPSHLELRETLMDSAVFAPRLVTSGPSLNGNTVDGTADARRQVRAQFEAGYDFLKLHPGLTADEFHAIAETANELGIPFAGHVPVAVGVRDALAAGMATIDHLDGYLAALLPTDRGTSGGYGGFFDVLLANDVDPDRIAALVAATAASGTRNVPTQTLFEFRVSATPAEEIVTWPEMQYVTPLTLRNWIAAKHRQYDERGFDAQTGARAIELRRRLILELHRSGAGILLGSDAPQVFNVPGFSAHRELVLLVESGLSPFEALETGTIAAAEFLGLNTGRVQSGRDADLVLLDANPLDDIKNSQRIHGVMLRGRWYSRAEISQRLARLSNANGGL